MPWSTPTLIDVRKRNRDYITSRLQRPLVPNSVTRVTADAGGGMAHLNLQYLDWLSLQLLVDTAETEWLDRQANIWLVNADGSKGRKAPTPASGTVLLSGVPGTTIPFGTLFGADALVIYQSIVDVTLGNAATEIPVVALDTGTQGNAVDGDQLSLVVPIFNVPGPAIVVSLLGGTAQETDDELRERLLLRIRQPPMGGDADDYVQWALSYPGVTRAWCSPKEMGIGTVTVRFMMDDLRAGNGGFPTIADVQNVQSWIDKRRPVTAIDTFVVAPLREPVSFRILNLDSHDASTLENITLAVSDMLKRRAAPAHAIDGITQPGTTIYAVWVSAAILGAVGVNSFDLQMDDHPMPSNGHLGVLGNAALG